mgnify:CR=1 FL=1
MNQIPSKLALHSAKVITMSWSLISWATGHYNPNLSPSIPSTEPTLQPWDGTSAWTRIPELMASAPNSHGILDLKFCQWVSAYISQSSIPTAHLKWSHNMSHQVFFLLLALLLWQKMTHYWNSKVGLIWSASVPLLALFHHVMQYTNCN